MRNRQVSSRGAGQNTESVPRPERNFGSSLQYGFFHFLLRVAGGRIPRWILALVVTWYSILPHGRRRSIPYLTHRFGPAGFFERFRQCWRLQHSLGTILLERLMQGQSEAGCGGVLFAGEVQSVLQELLTRGKGLIILSAHVGGWQGAVRELAFLDRPVNILQYRAQHHGDQQYFQDAGRAPIKHINAAGPFGGLLDAHSALKRNELVCIMGDRVTSPKEQVVGIPFLGGLVPFPTNAYRLAALGGTPLAILFVLRDDPPKGAPSLCAGSLRLHLAQVLELKEEDTRPPEGLRDAAVVYVAALESIVKQFPYQFFNFYDLWQQEKRT